MLSGILFTALIAATPATFSTSTERAQCADLPPMSTLQLQQLPQQSPPPTVDDGLDEPDAAENRSGVTPGLASAVTSNCSEPPLQSAPALVDCNDARMSPWVDYMIGSCDMPRGAAPPSLRPQRATTAMCDLFSCGTSTPPLRGVVRTPEDVHLFAVVPVLLPLVLDASPLDERSTSMPRSVEGPPPERPPRPTAA